MHEFGLGEWLVDTVGCPSWFPINRIPQIFGLQKLLRVPATGTLCTTCTPNASPVDKISCFHRQRDSLVDSLWAISETTVFLLSREKILTLTSHREWTFYSINFEISQNNHILPLILLGSPPFVLDVPGRVRNILSNSACICRHFYVAAFQREPVLFV